MILYIQIENGKTVNHPISKENLEYFFSDITESKPPEGFARFVRKPMPETPRNMRLDYIEYVYDETLSNKIGCPTYTDNYVFRKYTAEEREQLINEYKKIEPEKKDWIYDDTVDALIPPIPKPNDGKEYMWVFPDAKRGIVEGRWEQIETIFNDNEGLLNLLQAMKDIQQDMNVPVSALDVAKEVVVKTASPEPSQS